MAKRPPAKALKKLLQKKSAAAPKAIGPGSLLGGRYELASELGSGAFGAVFRAVDKQTNHVVAVKVLHEHVESEEVKMRMHREAHAMRQLAGTCAVGYLDYNQTPEGKLFLVMEFLDGQNLLQLLEGMEAAGRRLGTQEIAHLLGPIVSTLAYAHERGIIHRDLKPENIFVLREGGQHPTRLLDFGLVKDLSLEKLTAVGSVAGSPNYIAPEAWNGQPHQLDHRIDVYALGVILFRILSGAVPFEASGTLVDFVLSVTTCDRPTLSDKRPDLHPSIDAWAARALALKPDDRFQSVGEAWQGLGQVLGASGG